jgi:hypothetical protein
VPVSREQRFDHVGRGFQRRAVRLSRPVLQAASAFGLEALDPLVPGLAADAEHLAEFGHGKEPAVIIGDEATTFVHGRSLVPRQGAPPAVPALP